MRWIQSSRAAARRVGLCAACVALVASGCGGSDSGGNNDGNADAAGGAGTSMFDNGTGTMTGGIGTMAGGSDTMAGGSDTMAGGSAGMGGTAGSGAAGMAGMTDDGGSMDGMAGSGAAGMAGMTDDGGSMTGGACCSDGDCICREEPPASLSADNGPYDFDSYSGRTGEIFYPTDAEPPFAAVAICGGFLNTGAEMLDWGRFYASHGIVTIVTTTLPNDFPDVRATKLLASIEELKGEDSGSGPLAGKLAGRYGTSGYSMGGGGTTIASGDDSSLKTSVGLAAWGGVGNGVQVPTLLLCGSSDTVAPCSMSNSVYGAIPSSTPKMQVEIGGGTTHFNWFGPKDANRGESGRVALAFQKVFLEGDERWLPLLQDASPKNNL